MKIELKQEDIVQALKMHLDSQGIQLVDRSFDVTFKAGRKGTGISASVTIGLTPWALGATTKPVLVEAEVIKAPEPEPEPEYKVEPAPVKLPVIPTLPVFTPEAPVPIAANAYPASPLFIAEPPVATVTEEPVLAPIKTPSLFA